MTAKLKRSILAAVLAIAAIGCASESGSESSVNTPPAVMPEAAPVVDRDIQQPLTFGTADTGGMMYQVGSTIAKGLNSGLSQAVITVETSSGSIANAINLQAGQIDVAFVSAAALYDAYNGIGAFEGKACPDIRVVAACYPSFSNWVVSESSDICDVSQLSGKRIAVGPADSATAYVADLTLRFSGALGCRISNLGISEGIYSVQRGENDAAHAFVGVGLESIGKITSSKQGRLLPYSSEQLEKLTASNPLLYKTAIKAGSYKGQKQDIPTIGVKNYICVNASMEKTLAEELTRLLYQKREALITEQPQLADMLDIGFVCADTPIPLHKGAESFYSGIDVLK